MTSSRPFSNSFTYLRPRKKSSNRQMLKYTALAADGSEIRLLKAQPRQNDGSPLFTLDIVRLSDAGQFLYLTVAEQPRNPDGQAQTSRISINGAEIHVAEDILNGLESRHIRGQQDVGLWIEQLCVNQDDIADRDLHIRLRPRILRAAQSLVCLLQTGRDDNDPVKPASLLRNYLNGPWPDDTDKDQWHETANNRLQGFFGQPLWRDTKLFQEFALANEVVLVSGDHAQGWQEIGDLLWQLQSRDRPDDQLVPAAIGDLYSINNIRHRTTSSGWMWKTPMLDAVTWTAALRAGDPRDRLLRLFGVCFDAYQLLPRPSHSDTAAKLYTDFARALLPDVGPQLLCFSEGSNPGAAATGRTPGLPSWVPDWNNLPKQPTSSQKYMLETYRKTKTMTAASASASTAHVSLADDDTLTIQALTIGRITNLTSTPPSDTGAHAAPAPFPPSTAPQLRTDEPATLAGILAALQPSTLPFRDPATQRKIGNPSAYQLQRRCLRQLFHSAGPDDDDVVPPRLRAWRTANAAFPIQDRTLADWARADFSLHPSADDYLLDPAPPHSHQFAVFLARLQPFVDAGMRMVVTETGVVGCVDGLADARVGDRVVWLKGSGRSFLLRKEEEEDGAGGDDGDEERGWESRARFRVVCQVRLQDDYISPVARFARGLELRDADWDDIWRRGAWVDEVDLA